jgi:hypothetical protein
MLKLPSPMKFESGNIDNYSFPMSKFSKSISDFKMNKVMAMVHPSLNYLVIIKYDFHFCYLFQFSFSFFFVFFCFC